MSKDRLIVTPTGAFFRGVRLPYSMGKGGLRKDKCEGDGATPWHTMQITGVFYRPDRVRPPSTWAVPIGPNDLWSDASGDPAYNTHVRTPYRPSHETLRRADPLYDVIITTDWNWPNAVAGKGSAIFLHQWRRPHFPTEGCLAFSRRDIWELAHRVSLKTRIEFRFPT